MTDTTVGAIAPTIAALPAAAAERYGERLAARHLSGGEWTSVSYAETWAEVQRIARGLIALGIEPGERVAVLADTRVEWMHAGLAISCAGAVLVTVYPTNSAAECEWVLGDSGARAVICENRQQAAKVESVRARLPQLAHVIVIDVDPGSGSAPDGALPSLAGLADGGTSVEPAVLGDRAAAVVPEDLFTIIYTSGTTGPPKGVMLTHANAVAALVSIRAAGVLTADEQSYLFLPLAHIYALATALAAVELGTALVYYGGDPQQIVPELIATRPTYLPSVPRIFEKVYAAALKLRDTGDQSDRDRFDAAVRLGLQVRRLREGGEDVPAALQSAFERADAALYARVRGMFGGRVERALSAAAPIAPAILEFFYACGVQVLEGWGMTETTAVGTLSTPDHYRFGTVGRAAEGIELRIAPDGEVLMRGPNVFRGYWQNPEASAETLVGGWLHTGDLGQLDAEGYLSITGRKKDIIITAGGKNLTPANLENDLKQSPLISQAVMHGDRRPYPVALITLAPEELLPWARERGLVEDVGALAGHVDVQAAIQEVLDAANERYANVERIKRFTILPRDLTIEDGELTPTLKVKRSIVEQRYAAALDALYR